LLSLLDDTNYSAFTSLVTFGLEEIPSLPQSIILEEHSSKLDNNMALTNSHLLVKSLVSTIEENP
jgi:hypothetical protein